MRYAVLGTGEVGRTLGTKLAELGHEVTLGSRTKDNPAALEWARDTGAGARALAEASAFRPAMLPAMTPGRRARVIALPLSLIAHPGSALADRDTSA